MLQMLEGCFLNRRISPQYKSCLSSLPCGQHCPWLSVSQENFSASSLLAGLILSRQTPLTDVQPSCMSPCQDPGGHIAPSWSRRRDLWLTVCPPGPQDYITKLASSLKRRLEEGCPTSRPPMGFDLLPGPTMAILFPNLSGF